MPLIESAALPVFDSVIVCAALVVPTFWLPKLRLLGLSAAMRSEERRVGKEECGEPEAEPLKVREALRAPAALGVKVTATVQLLPAARLLPQVLLITTTSVT